MALILTFLRARRAAARRPGRPRPGDARDRRRNAAHPRGARHGVAVLVRWQRFAPSLHTVENNPLQDLMKSPRDAWLFALVVLVAGGIREEVQRAFPIHRFEVWLGGGVTGVIVTSTAFGAGHLLQGRRRDARDGPARRVLGCRVPATPIVCGADGQPRWLRPAADRRLCRREQSTVIRPVQRPVA